MSGFLEELPKRLFVVSAAVAALGAAFLYGVLAYRHNLPPLPQLRTVKATFVNGDMTKPARMEHLQPSRGQGAGVTINRNPDDGALVLMAGFFEEQNQIRLIRRDGELLRKWPLDYFEHFPDAATRTCDLSSPLRVDTHGAHVTPQGEVVFNYEYCGTVKLGQCGEMVWRIDKPTHHSLIPARAGGYWLLGRYKWKASEQPGRFPPFSTGGRDTEMLEDTLLRVSEDGEILEETSIPEIMLDNKLESLLTANGQSFRLGKIVDPELVHANKVSELPPEFAASYPLFEAGDLAISMRALNLVMIIDPVTKEVKWHQTGPWIRQHDPEFRPDGRISIFNNNVYRTAYDNEQTILSTPYVTNIIAVDPVSRQTEVLFGEKPGEEMLSVVRGQHELLDNGGMLITEFDAGRVLEVTADGQIVWAYVNRYDDDFVGEIVNSAIYSPDYFQREWGPCTR
jgi:hypothetical protein